MYRGAEEPIQGCTEPGTKHTFPSLPARSSACVPSPALPLQQRSAGPSASGSGSSGDGDSCISNDTSKPCSGERSRGALCGTVELLDLIGDQGVGRRWNKWDTGYVLLFYVRASKVRAVEYAALCKDQMGGVHVHQHSRGNLHAFPPHPLSQQPVRYF